MLERKHILKFTTEGTEGYQDPVTHNWVDGTPGTEVEVPCRFHQDTTKVFQTEDSTEVRQQGRIRVDIGSQMPFQGQELTVTEGDLVHFKGPARYVDRTGTILSWRIDV